MTIAKSWSKQTIELCQSHTEVPFILTSDVLAKASKDFGGLTIGRPVGVVFPKTTFDVSKLLKFADQNNVGFTIRSGGYSQGGQTLSPEGGVTIDCSQMTHIDTPNINTLTLSCQPGVTWRQAVEACAPYNVLPKVMPFFPNLTVGGVISIGGIGGNSHRYGCASGNIQALEVVTGSGNLNTCSHHENPELFQAALCGLGRCSVITNATIRLRPYKTNMVTYYLLFDNHDTWFEDIKRLWTNCDFLEAFCTPSLQGLYKQGEAWQPLPYWLYNLQISFEYEDQTELESHQKLLNSLKPFRLVHTEHSKTLDFVGRYGVRAQNMKASGAWEQVHPWLECLFPLDQLQEILPELLRRLPIVLGDGLGYRLFFVNGENQPPAFRLPSNSPIVGFAVLPTSIPETNRTQILETLEEVNEWLTAMGSKRGLAGWLGSSPQSFWEKQYGDYFQDWKALKNKYDPNNVLQSVLLNSIP